MNHRKINFVIGLILALSLVLTACASQPTPQTSVEQPAGKMVVRQWEYSADPNALEISKQMVEEFNSQSETIEIRLELIPRDIVRQKLLAAIEAGDPPDLVRFDLPWTPEFASAGRLEDITDKVNAWGEINDFYSGRLETVLLEGKYYGIPSNSNNLALVYNKEMVDAAGITEPPKTWAELKDYAQRLTVKTGGAIDVAGLVIGGRKNETIPFHFLPWLWQAGADVDQINSPAGVHALEEWQSYLIDGIIPEGMLGWGNSELRQQFEAGKAAMMINGPGHVAAIPKNVPDLEFGIWLLPCDTNCASVIGGEDWVIPMGAKGKEAAWEVLKYYSSPEVHEWWCTNTNTLPSRISVGKADIFNTDANLKVFVEQNEVAKPRPVHPRYAEMSEIIQVAVQSALTNQLSPQAALDQAHAAISDLLK
jgi:multiple sugar transport system substrate-binding protein